MKNSRERITEKTILFGFDLLVYSCVFYFFIRKQYELKFSYTPTIIDLIYSHYKAYLILIFFWIIISNTSKLYDISISTSFAKILYKSINQILLLIPVVFTVSGLKDLPLLERSNIIYFNLLILFFLIISRTFYKILYRNNVNKSYLFVGDNKELISFKEKLTVNTKVVLYSINDNEILDFGYFRSFVHEHKINKIIFSEKGIDDINFNKILNYCEDYQIEVNLLPISFEKNYYTYDVEYINGKQIIKVTRFPLDKGENHYIKLVVDKLVALFVCIFIMSWLFPLLAILIKIDSKGDVIFKQKRTGINGKSFDCYKFRTMRSDGTNSVTATVVNDNRITKLGNFLRKTSLDEFPQFFNVLKGDMSIIGPRPHMLTVDEYYSNVVNRYYFRYYVRPGITGLSQISGLRGDMTEENMNDRIRTDIFYIKNWSLLLDFKILIKTFLLVFKGDKNAI